MAVVALVIVLLLSGLVVLVSVSWWCKRWPLRDAVQQIGRCAADWSLCSRLVAVQ